MKLKYFKLYLSLATLSVAISGCSDWLDPKPKSVFVPENALTDYAGLKTASDMLNRDLRYVEYYPTALSAPPAFLTELVFSDVAVNGMTDSSNPPQDLNRQITPSANMNTLANGARCTFYWKSWYKGIKDANTIISRSADAQFDNEDQRKEILALAYFHRAYRYYRLVHQFGDVPLILDEITNPRYDFFSTKREITLRQMKSDLESTVELVPKKVNFGTVSQGAIYHLLAKINLALGEFDDAITAANKVIDGGYHSLMTQRFGSDAANLSKNVTWDLHRTENKSIPQNKEALYVVIDRYGTEAATSAGLEIMRNVLPWYSAANQLKTPDGKPAFVDNNQVKNPYLLQYGRGICTLRSSWYHTNSIWTGLDRDGYIDRRHDRNSGNWIDMEDLTYNNPDLDPNNPNAKNKTDWYGKNLKKGETLCADTIRCWVAWPHYKVYIPEQRSESWRGGNGDWYIFRLAETYLLRAEAYCWKGEIGMAKADINAVRDRAGASPLKDSEVTIRAILDERARELFYEEPRKTELTRISYIYAKTGKAADNGKTYSLSNFSEDNFFYDHIMATTDFYNKGIKTGKGNEYTISPRHVLWPIAEASINANVNGRINQNIGYAGAENNVEPIDHAN